MAKAPTKPVKRQVRRTAAVLNQSRAAGAPAPPSAAATAPRTGTFYDPDARTAPAERMPDAVQPDNPLRRAHNAAVADRSVQDERLPGISADVEVAVGAQTEAGAAVSGESYEETVARIRAMRKPLGAYSQKLALPKRPGYHRHWFNDEGARIEDALNNGWANVLGKDRKPLKRAVGRGRDQGVLYAYAMELPEVFYLEDMAERHRVAAEKVAALKQSPGRSKGGANKADQGKFYSPVEDTGREFLEVDKV